MGREVAVFSRKETVGTVVATLAGCKHHGFPVVHTNEHGDKVLHGLILRRDVLKLLTQRVFLPDEAR